MNARLYLERMAQNDIPTGAIKHKCSQKRGRRSKYMHNVPIHEPAKPASIIQYPVPSPRIYSIAKMRQIIRPQSMLNRASSLCLPIQFRDIHLRNIYDKSGRPFTILWTILSCSISSFDFQAVLLVLVGAGAPKLTVFGPVVFGVIFGIEFSIGVSAEIATGAGDSKKEKSAEAHGSELVLEMDGLIGLAAGIELGPFEGEVAIERGSSAVVGGFGLETCAFVAMPLSTLEFGECV